MIVPELEAWQGVELFWNIVPRTETWRPVTFRVNCDCIYRLLILKGCGSWLTHLKSQEITTGSFYKHNHFCVVEVIDYWLYFCRSASVVCDQRVAHHPLHCDPPLLHPLINASSWQCRNHLNALPAGLSLALLDSSGLLHSLLLSWTVLELLSSLTTL